MSKHIKPTLDELDQGADQAVKEAEAIKAKEEADKATQEKEIEEKIEEIEKPPEEETEVEEIEEPEIKEEIPEEKPKEKIVEKEIDYKEKFTESTKESQILYSNNKKIREALAKVDEVPEPTEEELTKEFTDWEVMTDFEKRIAKNDIVNSRKLEAISKVNKEFADTDAWNDKVNDFTADPKNLITYPGLEGKENEFKIFSNKATRRGTDFEDLVSAFLFNVETTRPKNKGSQLETTTGDTNKQKPKSNKITIEQAKILRDKDYNKWKEMLVAGKIESDV